MNRVEIEIDNNQHKVIVDLDNLESGKTHRVSSYDVTVVEIANTGTLPPYHKKFAVKVEDYRTEKRVIERFIIDMRNSPSSIQLQMNIINDIPLQQDAIGVMSERMYFFEELTDLFVGDFITKERYLQLRRLFKSKEIKMALKIVKELHTVHILTNVPLEDLTRLRV